MNIAIIDDERPARMELQFLLASIFENAQFYEAESAETALQILNENYFQLIFLDINLGDMNGTVLASHIRETQPQAGIIFVTAYQDYAVKAFELDAVDYILKPFDLNRIRKTAAKLQMQGYIDQQESSLDKLALPAGDRIMLIDISDIVYIEANQRICEIHTINQVFEENVTLSRLLERLHGKPFYRIHKSYVVNLNYVKELIPNYNNGYAMNLHYASKPLPISRNEIKKIRHMYTL